MITKVGMLLLHTQLVSFVLSSCSSRLLPLGPSDLADCLSCWQAPIEPSSLPRWPMLFEERLNATA